jgi:hypothetical protein
VCVPGWWWWDEGAHTHSTLIVLSTPTHLPGPHPPTHLPARVMAVGLTHAPPHCVTHPPPMPAVNHTRDPPTPPARVMAVMRPLVNGSSLSRSSNMVGLAGSVTAAGWCDRVTTAGWWCSPRGESVCRAAAARESGGEGPANHTCHPHAP